MFSSMPVICPHRYFVGNACPQGVRECIPNVNPPADLIEPPHAAALVGERFCGFIFDLSQREEALACIERICSKGSDGVRSWTTTPTGSLPAIPRTLTGSALLLEAVGAVDRFIPTWEKWYLGLLAAACTGRRVHFPIPPTRSVIIPIASPSVPSPATLCLPLLATAGAACWLVREPLLCIEFLLTGGENEIHPTLPTG